MAGKTAGAASKNVNGNPTAQGGLDNLREKVQETLRKISCEATASFARAGGINPKLVKNFVEDPKYTPDEIELKGLQKALRAFAE